MSLYVCPRLTNTTGFPIVFAIDSAAPPFASASIFVRTIPSKPTASWNCFACSIASLPARASPMYRIRFGFATRLIFFIWSIRFWFVCIRPAVSIRTTSRPRQRLRDRIPQGHLDALFEARLPRDPLPSEVLRKAVHDLLGDRERHVRLEEGDLEVVQDLLELVFLDLAPGVADRLGRHLGF